LVAQIIKNDKPHHTGYRIESHRNIMYIDIPVDAALAYVLKHLGFATEWPEDGTLEKTVQKFMERISNEHF
jgi:hypothetical protein